MCVPCVIMEDFGFINVYSMRTGLGSSRGAGDAAATLLLLLGLTKLRDEELGHEGELALVHVVPVGLEVSREHEQDVDQDVARHGVFNGDEIVNDYGLEPGIREDFAVLGLPPALSLEISHNVLDGHLGGVLEVAFDFPAQLKGLSIPAL